MLVDTQMCVSSEGKHIFIFGVPSISGLYYNLSHPGTFHVPPGTFHRSLGLKYPRLRTPGQEKPNYISKNFIICVSCFIFRAPEANSKKMLVCNWVGCFFGAYKTIKLLPVVFAAPRI